MLSAADRATQGLGPALRVFADPIRLRILALLELEELTVGELARTLGLAQSRVSNHLRLLREAGLLVERKSGTSTHLRAALDVSPPETSSLAARVWAVLREEVTHVPASAADRVRLAAVLGARRADEGEFFDRLAGDWDKIAGAFQTGRARERAAAQLLPGGLVLADLGCGTGYMAEALAGNCARLICVDRSERMLAEAEHRLSRTRRATVLDFRQGELDDLPIADGELDGLVAGMVFHHLPSLEGTLREFLRVLKPGSAAVVLELAPHREAWMRPALGDRHLGLESAQVLAAFERAGFEDLVLDPVEDAYRPRRSDADGENPSLDLYLVRGRKPRVSTAESR